MSHPLIDVIELSQKRCDSPIQCQLAYATKENFLGRIVDGYHTSAINKGFMTKEAAHALCQAQSILNKSELGLFLYDSYRPLRAVRDFCNWMHAPVSSEYELARKKIHYPHIEKSQLAELGYVCDHVSNHCFGNTVDVVLVDLKTNQHLNFGTCYDFFDELSYPSTPAEKIGVEAYQNRKRLSDVMQEVGYMIFTTEYWHFTYKDREVEQPLDVPVV